MRKTPNDWQAIFKQQKESGLSIKLFCKHHKISTSSFYKYKQLKRVQSGFIQAKVVQHTSTTEQVTESSADLSVITLETSAGCLSLPSSTAPAFLIQLLRGLS